MLVVEDLHKRYGYVRAVQGVSLKLDRGRVLGLVGPNGAGKTTTMKSIVGLVIPDRGRIIVEGRDALRDPEARRLIAYAPETPVGPAWIRACDLLEHLAVLDGYSRLEARRLAREALESFGLGEYCMRRLGGMSKGQRKRVLLAAAFMVERDYYLLDEPASGLDPEWVARVRERIVEAARKGSGVMVSSHLLRELQGIIDEVAIILGGRVVFQGTLQDLAEKMGGGSVVVVKTRDPARAARILEEAGYRVTLTAGSVRVYLPRGASAKSVLEALEAAGVPVESFEYREADLEDAYLRLVGGSHGS